MKMRRWLCATHLLLPALVGCSAAAPAATQKSPPPAKVETPAKEPELATITLTPNAEERLGIRLVAVKRRPIRRTRMLGGEVVIPPGGAVTVSAPLTGTLAAAANSGQLVAGRRLEKGSIVFTLEPLLTPLDRVRLAELVLSLASSRVDADAQAEQAKVRAAAARIAFDRAEQLVRDKAGSAKSRDDAKAALDIADRALGAAEARRELLSQATLDVEAGAIRSLPIESPSTGVLRSLHAAAGQSVAAGAPLFEVARIDTVWVRVPVYVGDLGAIDPNADARIGQLSGAITASPRVAKRVVAPPAADAVTATADLTYELENADASLRPGQRVGATVTLRGEQDSLVAPWSAVVHDIHGGTWVYESTGPQVYVRRRVSVAYVLESDAVLAAGPKPGTQVVTDGAAELFGAEFGFGK